LYHRFFRESEEEEYEPPKKDNCCKDPVEYCCANSWNVQIRVCATLELLLIVFSFGASIGIGVSRDLIGNGFFILDIILNLLYLIFYGIMLIRPPSLVTSEDRMK
jgi:hypothetical protein